MHCRKNENIPNFVLSPLCMVCVCVCVCVCVYVCVCVSEFTLFQIQTIYLFFCLSQRFQVKK